VQTQQPKVMPEIPSKRKANDQADDGLIKGLK
jgi:hypothetical protein